MITWNNLDTLESFKELSKVGRVDIKEAMSGVCLPASRALFQRH